MVKRALGKYCKSGELYSYDFPENKQSHIRNTLFIDKQGSGKTNLLMSLLFEMYKLYDEREGKHGSLPIVFSPFFEWADLKVPSMEQNLSPNREPESLDASQLTFQMAEPSNPDDFEVIAFKFNDLSVEDIASFGNMGNFNDLGKIRKLINVLKEGGTVKGKNKEEIEFFPNPNYTIKDFLKLVEFSNGVGDALYYVFAKLDDNGFFDTVNYKPFEWFELIKRRKPIIVSFGDISEPALYQAVAGYMLRKLHELGKQYFKAYQKDNDNKELNADERFLLKYFKIALFFEEAHHFFPNTISGTLSSFPAIYYFILLSQKIGRKQGFKYFYLITQKVKFVYFGIRTEQDNIFLGWKLGSDDRDFMLETYKQLDEDYLGALIRLPKFSFCVFNPKRFENKLAFADKFTAFRSPAGMPK